jgi:Ca2+/Na+ antiporter
VGNISFNYSLTWPKPFQEALSEFGMFNIDVLSVLGLNCMIDRFDHIHQSVCLHRPFSLSLSLLFCFVFTFPCLSVLIATLAPLGVATILLAVNFVVNHIDRSRNQVGEVNRKGRIFDIPEEYVLTFKEFEIENFKTVRFVLESWFKHVFKGLIPVEFSRFTHL